VPRDKRGTQERLSDFIFIHRPLTLTNHFKSSKSKQCPYCRKAVDRNVEIVAKIDSPLKEIYRTCNISEFRHLLKNDAVDIEANLDYVIYYGTAEFLANIIDYMMENDVQTGLLPDIDLALSLGKKNFAKILLHPVLLHPHKFAWGMSLMASISRIIENKKVKMMRFFLDNIPAEQHMEYFFEFCEFRSLDYVKFWIECLPNFDENHIYIALRRSLRAGNVEIFDFLIDFFEIKSVVDNEQILLRLISEKRHWRALNFLKKLKFSTACNYSFTIGMAISEHKLDIVKSLWNIGMRPDIQELSECLIAVTKLRDEVGVRTLLNLGALPTYMNNEALIRACELNDLSIIRLLITHGSDIHARDGTPIKIAIEQSQEATLEFFLMNANGSEPYPANVVELALTRSSSKILKLLEGFIKSNCIRKENGGTPDLTEKLNVLTKKAKSFHQMKEMYITNIRPEFIYEFRINILNGRDYQVIVETFVTNYFIYMLSIRKTSLHG
jgi:hypothetical protein